MAHQNPEPAPSDPPITVESGTPGNIDTPQWTVALATRTEHHRCPHRLDFSDLNARGRTLAAWAATAVLASWLVLVFGFLVGLVLFVLGSQDADRRAALLGLLLLCGTALQPFGTVALTSVRRRPHRPHDAVIAAAAVGFLVFLVATGMLVAIAEIYAAPLFAVPFAAVLVLLFRFRATLYGRDTCRSHPGYAPAVRALLAHDPGPSAVIAATERFRLADCPHRLAFGEFRRSAQVMSIVNSVLLVLYFAALLGLMFVLVARPEFGRAGPVREATAYLAAGTMMLLNLPGFREVQARSLRYHRASITLYVGAFTGYGLTAATGVWAAVVLDDPMPLAVTLLASYWAYAAWAALTRLPSRAECGALQEPPPVIQKMLKP